MPCRGIFHKCQLVVSRTDSENLSAQNLSVGPIRVTQWSHTNKLITKRRRLSRMRQVEALAEAIVMVQSTPLRVPCVELSESTSSVPCASQAGCRIEQQQSLPQGQRKNSSSLFSSGNNHSCPMLRAIRGTVYFQVETTFFPVVLQAISGKGCRRPCLLAGSLRLTLDRKSQMSRSHHSLLPLCPSRPPSLFRLTSLPTAVVLRGTIVNRTYGVHKILYI